MRWMHPCAKTCFMSPGFSSIPALIRSVLSTAAGVCYSAWYKIDDMMVQNSLAFLQFPVGRVLSVQAICGFSRRTNCVGKLSITFDPDRCSSFSRHFAIPTSRSALLHLINSSIEELENDTNLNFQAQVFSSLLKN